MNSILVYRSHYGSTGRYAAWLAEETGMQAVDARKVTRRQLAECSCIVYGGGLYAGGVSGLPAFLKKLPPMEDRRLAVFTVGLADPAQPGNTEKIRADVERLFARAGRAALLEKTALFHLRGAMDYGRLNTVHSLMMKMLRNMLERTAEEKRTPEDRQLLDTFGGCVDFTDRAALAPLGAWVRQQEQEAERNIPER